LKRRLSHYSIHRPVYSPTCTMSPRTLPQILPPSNCHYPLSKTSADASPKFSAPGIFSAAYQKAVLFLAHPSSSTSLPYLLLMALSSSCLVLSLLAELLCSDSIFEAFEFFRS